MLLLLPSSCRYFIDSLRAPCRGGALVSMAKVLSFFHKKTENNLDFPTNLP